MFDFLRNLTKSAEEKQQEAMNAYLDDALTPRQHHRFEAQLAQDADLQAELAQRRRLKQQMRQLPHRPAPRNFMLDPALYGRPQKQPLVQMYPALRMATALAAFLFILIIATDLFLVGGNGASLSEAAPDIARVAEDTAEAPVEQAVEVTRIVVETETVTEEVVVEVEVETEVAEEGTVEEPAAEAESAAVKAPAEPEETMPDDTADTVTDAFAGEAEAPLPAATKTDEDMSEIAPTTPATAAATMPPPAATPTTSESPRLTATTIADTNRAGTAVPPVVDEQDDGETAVAPTDSQTTGITEQKPAPSPLSGLQLLQIGLGLLFVILALLTFYARRQI